MRLAKLSQFRRTIAIPKGGQNGDKRSIAKDLQNGKIKRVISENVEGTAENQKSRRG